MTTSQRTGPSPGFESGCRLKNDDTPAPNDWKPIPGPQTNFLKCSAYELLFGGQAGGSKSESLLVAPLRWVTDPHFRGLLLRRTFSDLEKSLIDRSRQLYPRAFPGAKYSGNNKVWQFPSGAILYFGYCDHDKDVYQYQGAEFQFIGFDELTQFSERQYTYLLSRARSSKGTPIRVRATTNPGGEGHEWVFKRWAPWLDTRAEYAGVRALPGQKLWYVNEDGERYVPEGTTDALSRVFIPSKLTDNPYLLNSTYMAQLKGLDPVTRAQLLDGNWLIKPAKGLYFKRAWLTIVDAAPIEAKRIRFWDRGATTTGDWTVGVRMAKTKDSLLWVEDVVRMRGTPGEVKKTILETAKLDGKAVMVGLSQDPGQAGVFEADDYSKSLQGFNVRFLRESGTKIVRAQPFSAQVEHGNVRIVRGHWNEPYIQTLEGFPEWEHDDDVDASSGAFALLPRSVVGKTESTLVDRETRWGDDSGW